MKKTTHELLITLTENELEVLTREIKETIAFDAMAKKTKPVFTAANLWNIHKMRKPIKRRMFIQ